MTVTPRTIEPVEFIGPDELFSPKITDEELESLKDASGDIRFENVFGWTLPRFGETDYFEFMAARMRNYMIHIMRTKNFKPRHYNPSPTVGRRIEAHHVARFYGIHMARMTRGFPSIEETWSSRESLKHIGPAAECMPKDAYIDMYRCMHFSDDWEVDENGDQAYWEDVAQDARMEPSPEVTRHRMKFEHIEDG